MQTKTFEKLPEEKKQTILDASARVFAEKGYFQAGISEICEAAQISNGALYKYFINKEGLYRSIVRRTLDLIFREYDQFSDMAGSFWELPELMLEQVYSFSGNRHDYLVVLMDLGSPSMDSFSSEFSDELEQKTFEHYARFIDAAKERGEIRKTISTETAAYLIDNHILLLAYSFISNHYNRRFHQYFRKKNSELDKTGKIELVIRSFKELLTWGTSN